MAEFGKLPFQVAFDPTTGFILDARQYFESYDAAVEAAKSAKEVGSKETVYHYGMQLLVDDGSTVKWYIITRSNTLEPFPSGSSGGGTTFEPGNTMKLVDGVLDVKTTDDAEADNTLPITSSAVHTIVGNIEVLLNTI